MSIEKTIEQYEEEFLQCQTIADFQAHRIKWKDKIKEFPKDRKPSKKFMEHSKYYMKLGSISSKKLI